MKEQPLEKLRKEIDTLNADLVTLLTRRAEVAQQIGVIKGGGQVYMPSREAQVLEQIRRLNVGPLDNNAMEGIFKEIIAACRNLERRLVVAYLGPEGTYSQEAARKHAGTSSEYAPYNTIDDVTTAVEKGRADIAVVPVENSTEGAVSRTLDLLLESNLLICGEVMLPIRHQLLTHAAKLEEISEVLAHPQALAQCRRWLAEHLPGVKITSVPSNAEAARLAVTSLTTAAIAGKLAADTYGLPALCQDIQDSGGNTTRFLVLGSTETTPTGNDKTSLVCSVPNRAGSLYDLLGILTAARINMTKLESRPAESALWDYVFYIDIDGHHTEPAVTQALQQMKEHATLVKVLGSYPKARS